jgi:hypothetical protein
MHFHESQLNRGRSNSILRLFGERDAGSQSGLMCCNNCNHIASPKRVQVVPDVAADRRVVHQLFRALNDGGRFPRIGASVGE